MDPTPEALAAVNDTQRAFLESPVWAPALEGTSLKTPLPSVEPLRTGDIHYFLFEFARNSIVTARFAIAPDGALLEAEGVKHLKAMLKPFIDPRAVRLWANGRPLRQVWKPCNESTLRLRPLWEVSASPTVSIYMRVDGVVFGGLTINAGRG